MNTPAPHKDAPDLYAYLDYREFLLAHYEHRRELQKTFSYRFMAARLDVDAGQLAHILKGRLQLPQRALSAAIALCKLDERQGAYFEELVRLASCKDEDEKARITERLDALREVTIRQIPSSCANFYAHWKHSTLRALAGILPETGDGSGLGRHCLPPLSGQEACESVAFLEKSGLLQRDEWGRLQPAEAHVAPAPEVPRETLRRWHDQVLALAGESLDRIPSDRRRFHPHGGPFADRFPNRIRMDRRVPPLRPGPGDRFQAARSRGAGLRADDPRFQGLAQAQSGLAPGLSPPTRQGLPLCRDGFSGRWPKSGWNPGAMSPSSASMLLARNLKL